MNALRLNRLSMRVVISKRRGNHLCLVVLLRRDQLRQLFASHFMINFDDVGKGMEMNRKEEMLETGTDQARNRRFGEPGPKS